MVNQSAQILWEKDFLRKVQAKIYQIHIERLLAGKQESYKVSILRSGNVIECLPEGEIDPRLKEHELLHNIEVRINLNKDSLYR